MIFISIFSQINFLNTIHISIDLFFQAKITPLCKITPPQKKITIQDMFVVPLLLFNTNCTMWFYCKAEMKKWERERLTGLMLVTNKIVIDRQNFVVDSRYKQVLISPCLHGWCILWYLCTRQAWMLILSHKFWMLYKVKVFEAGALLWLYLTSCPTSPNLQRWRF